MKELWDLSIPVLKKALQGKTDKITGFKKIEIALALVQKFTPQQPAIINNNTNNNVTSIMQIAKEIDGNGNKSRQVTDFAQMPDRS